jgi:hypothetical protein
VRWAGEDEAGTGRWDDIKVGEMCVDHMMKYAVLIDVLMDLCGVCLCRNLDSVSICVNKKESF